MVAPTAGVAVKRDSDGRNPFSHYPCYVELTPSAQEPSALDRRSQCNLNRRSRGSVGKVSRRSRDESATSLRDVGGILPTAKYSRAARTEGAGGCAKANFADIASQEKLSPRAKEQSFSVKPFFKKACGVSGRSPERNPDLRSDRDAFAHQINKQRSKR